MDYKSFAEFLNHSREAKDLLGTSSLLRDQTGGYLQAKGGYRGPGDKQRIENDNAKVLQVTSPDENDPYNMNGANSWMGCSQTLHNLLEHYFSDTSALSSFKQMFDKNNLQEGDVRGDSQDHVTSHAPPPLLHCPTKRSLEQSHVTMTSPDPKRSRLENYYEEKPVRMTNKTSYAREEMFEKTRSYGNPSKPLGPPPPLLKQPPEEKHGSEIRWGSLTKHYTKDRSLDPAVEWMASRNKGGCKTNTNSLENTSRNASTPGQHHRQAESFKTKPAASPSSNGKQEVRPAQPQPRQIESEDKSTCGGYAFDHMAMPKIVAVHSVSKSSKDREEWEKNKAFISQAKASQDQRIDRLQRRAVAAQIQGNLVQAPDLHRQQLEAMQAMFANAAKNSSEEVSFERYVLYYLLSKFQGNVEQVKRVLKQNLLQEWLAYSQGNVDPSKLSFSGVNLNELRKLYVIWCQLQRNQGKNSPQSTSSHSISNLQNSTLNRTNTGSDSTFKQNQQMRFLNSKCSPNSQHQGAGSRLPRNYSPHNASGLSQAVPRASVNPSAASQQVNSFVIDCATQCESSKDIPLHVQEKIYALSQNSLRETNRSVPTPAPHIQPTNQHPAFNENQAKLSLRSDMCNVKRLAGDQVKINALRLAQQRQENSARNQCQTYENTPQRNVFERERRMAGRDISHAAMLRHLAQTAAKQNQNQSLSLENSITPSSNTISRRSSYSHSAQSHQHLLEQAVRSESRGNDVIHEEEAKASYLWRFKGGKLISDNMPSINRGEPLTQIELDELVSSQRKNVEVRVSMEATREVHASGQKSYHKASVSMSRLSSEQACNNQSNQSSVLTAEQQHKKVCGAAASGQRCYCVLDHKGFPQRAQKSDSPIASPQRMTGQPRQISPVTTHVSPGQSPNTKMQTSTTESAQVYQQPDHILRSSPRDIEQFHTNIHVSSIAQANPNCNASVHVSQATSKAQANQHSSAGHQASPKALSDQQSNASFYASRAAQVNQQSSAHANQTPSRDSPTTQVKQHSRASFQVSAKAQANQRQPSVSFQVSRIPKKDQQSNAQANQQSLSSFRIPRILQGSQKAKPKDSQKSELATSKRKTQQSNTRFILPRTAQTHQQSNDSLKTSNKFSLSQISSDNHITSKTSKEVDEKECDVERKSPPKRGRPRKTATPAIVVKSEKIKDNNSSFLASLPPKKQYTSLEQLAKKVIETRQRFEMENIPWKKKILKSLEGVLMKRLRKIEKETGEEADLGIEKESETDTTEQDNKK